MTNYLHTFITSRDLDYPTSPPMRVRWWDLAGGHHGVRAVSDATTAQAAPGGWLYTTGGTPGSATLWRETTGGAVSLMASADVIRNARIGYRSSRKRVVVYGNDEGQGNPGVGWIGYHHPGRLHQLLPHAYSTCSTPTGGFVACSALTYVTDTSTDARMDLLALDGGRSASDRRRCDLGESPVIVRGRAVWISDGGDGCGGGRLVALSATGRRSISRIRVNPRPIFNNYGLVAAFGRIVVLARTHRTIYSLRSVTSKPQVVVHTS